MNLLTLLFDRFTILLTAVLPAQGAFAALFDGLTHAGIALLFFLHGARLSRRAIIDGADAEPAAQAHPGAGGRRRLRAERISRTQQRRPFPGRMDGEPAGRLCRSQMAVLTHRE